MLHIKKRANAAFYRAAGDWTYDMYHSQTVWLRRSLLLIVALLLLLSGSLLLNLFLFPLKEKVPYLYAFDHATGEVTKIGTLEPTQFNNNWELTRYFLIHYVNQYESYDYDNIDQPYQMVWAQSSDRVRAEYEGKVKSDNPNSPYHIYGKDKYITTRVIAINRLNENTADIKFEKTLHDHATSIEQITQKEAIIKWEFSATQKTQTTQKMLDRDPLGFKVTYYQVSQVNLENDKG